MVDEGKPKPVIVDVSGHDVDEIWNWKPEDPNEVSEWVDISFGPDETAGEWFQIHLCTPASAHGLSDKRSLLIIPYYEDWNSVLAVLDDVLEECRGYDWADMRSKLAKRFTWEYEGMAGT